MLFTIVPALAPSSTLSSAPVAVSPVTLLACPAVASTKAFTDCCVGTSVALSDVMSSSSTNAVIVILPSDKLPKVIVPVVVIALEPLLIAPNPLVILPELSAPTEVTLPKT